MVAVQGQGLHIDIQVDRPHGSYYPDDEVKGTITVDSDRFVAVREMRAGLVYSQGYQVTAKTAQNPVTRWNFEENWVDTDILTTDAIPVGFNRVYKFSFRLPPDPLPPCAGQIVNNRWLVKVVTDLPRARDLVAEAELPVIVPVRGKGAEGGTYSNQDTASAAFIGLSLPRLDYVDGDTIKGQLTVAPEHELEARGVRVELVRLERTPVEGGKRKETVVQVVNLAGKATLPAGKPITGSFPLLVTINGCPSFHATHTEVSWFVQGVVDLARSKDVRVQQEVTLYNGSPRD